MELRHSFDNQPCPKEGISIDVCSHSHPFNTDTGEQKTFDVGGRAEHFRKRFDLTAKIMEVGGS